MGTDVIMQKFGKRCIFTLFSFPMLCLFGGVFCSVLIISSIACFGAMVTYSFDDGFRNTKDVALPILEAHGHVGTISAVCYWIGGQNVVTIEDLAYMEDKGWEIVSHSITHHSFNEIPKRYSEEVLTGWLQTGGTSHTFQTTYSYAKLPFVLQDGYRLTKRGSIPQVENNQGSYYFDSSSGINGIVYVHTNDGSSPEEHEMRADSVEREIEQSILKFRQAGLNVQNFIPPFDQWTYEMAEIAGNYCNSVAFGSVVGLNEIPIRNPWFLRRMWVVQDTPLESVKARVDYAIAHNQWLIIELHLIGDFQDRFSWSAENLQALADYIASTGIAVVTQQEGLQRAQRLPIHRFWSPVSGSHFYTISEEEKSFIIATWPEY